jgi:transposase
MDKRLFPVSRDFFETLVVPMIRADYIWKGRPAEISHYSVFCAILYVLRTGIPWRDLPKVYGNWHSIYQRFRRGCERGLWWKILFELQKNRQIRVNIVLTDSTSMKLHRHGGGLKGGSKAKAEAEPD